MSEAFIENLARDIYKKSLEMIEEETGVRIDRLCQLAKADKENRIVILEEGETY